MGVGESGGGNSGGNNMYRGSAEPVLVSLSDSVKIVDGGLYFIFSFHFYFTFLFLFLFLEQLGLGFIGHAVTSVTN